MWGFTTDQSWYVRAAVGAALGAFLLAAIPAALRWINAKQAEIEGKSDKGAIQVAQPSPPPQSDQRAKKPATARGPTLEASGNSTIDATGAIMPNNLPFQFARAADGSVVSMPGLVVTDNHDGTYTLNPGGNPVTLQFPSPTGEFSGLTNAELKAREIKAANDLRDFQNRMMAEWRTLPRDPHAAGVPHDVFTAFSQKYHGEYEKDFLGSARSLASEMMVRIVKAVPGASFPATSGMRDLYYGTFAGPRPALEVAEALDMLRQSIPD